MDYNFEVLLIFLIILLSLFVLLYYGRPIVDNFSNPIETHIVTDNVILHDGKEIKRFDNYDYATLSNGSLQKINEIMQNVIDTNNCGARLITFNSGLSPVTKVELDKKECDEYSEFIITMMNNNIMYKCFTFISSEPGYKVKTENQVKMQFHINALYKHPDSVNDEIMFRFLLILLNDNPYCEYNNFNEEPTADQLPFDIVASEGKTYIEVFAIDNKR